MVFLGRDFVQVLSMSSETGATTTLDMRLRMISAKAIIRGPDGRKDI